MPCERASSPSAGILASTLLAAVDAFRAMLAALRDGRSDEHALHAGLEAELGAWVASAKGKGDLPAPSDTTPPPSEPSPVEPLVNPTRGPALRIDMAKIDQLLSLASRALVLQGQMGTALLESGAANGDLLELHQRNERLLMGLETGSSTPAWSRCRRCFDRTPGRCGTRRAPSRNRPGWWSKGIGCGSTPASRRARATS